MHITKLSTNTCIHTYNCIISCGVHVISILPPLLCQKHVVTKILTLAPGDSLFKLPPHVDGGGLERWSDPNYREVPDSMVDRIHSLLLLTLMHTGGDLCVTFIANPTCRTTRHIKNMSHCTILSNICRIMYVGKYPTASQ
jgi:hypothetical protein